MEIKQALDSHFDKDSVVTIGTFDGVHIGHQKIIKRLVKIAKKNKMQAIVLTFFPHPRMVLQQDSSIKLINTIDEKSMLLSKFGIDHLVIKEFTTEFSRLSALEFVRDILVNRLKTKYIIIGYDHHFGRNRAANIDDLREFGDAYDFKVIEISAQEINDVAVSSTKIRKAILEGDIKSANAYLGYNFMLTGTVVTGKGRGKTLDFPTANLVLDEDYKLRPKNGVYVISSIINDAQVFGMMNIGTNPTFNSSEEQFIEINFFDFEKDIYDHKLQIEILDRLRDEQKFDSAEALKAQLKIDKEMALMHISKYHA
ncbi:MAG: bifunctional riboflavin kinase/FAD synthetase [Bacteroidia bacterium]|nr:bifunctional riboflavin kinase/FAD synthetase [Bacteroidia bacterium]NND51295.1 bifunctional riboflavin kinase/FAD synthetase [Flavobacteriaceae bacterium]